jgi:immune inhibitor A
MSRGASQRFQDLFFSTGKIETGSVTEYYTDVNGGKISLTGEIAGPYRMLLKLADYAHGANGLGTVSPNLQTLGAVTGYINFGLYDNDGNGYVDAFIVIHADMGGEVTGVER